MPLDPHPTVHVRDPYAAFNLPTASCMFNLAEELQLSLRHT